MPAPADVPEPAPRRRRGLGIRLGLIALLIVLIVAVPHAGSRSRSLPAGPWGATIACLERNALYRVTDARSATAALPDAQTTEITVMRRAQDQALAEIKDAATPARAAAVRRADPFGEPAADEHLAGPIVWAWIESGSPPRATANPGDRTLISYCIARPRR